MKSTQVSKQKDRWCLATEAISCLSGTLYAIFAITNNKGILIAGVVATLVLIGAFLKTYNLGCLVDKCEEEEARAEELQKKLDRLRS